MREGPMMTDEEFAFGLANATARGLIEWQGDEELRLTDKGVDHAINLRETLGDMDYIIMELFFERIHGAVEEQNEQ